MTLPTPPITVITAALNVRDGIAATIENVLSQDYGRIEHIVIDGGSTDGTLDIIKRYENRLAYWGSAPDKGLYDAMNKGWDIARKDSFILFLGAGDKILSLPKDIGKYGPGDVLCGKVFVGEDGSRTSHCDFRLKIFNTLHHQAVLVNKGIHPQAPFDLGFPTFADFDFHQRLLKAGARFHYLEDFRSYMATGGTSSGFRHWVVFPPEPLKIVFKNFGPFWGGISSLYHLLLLAYLRMRGRTG